MLNHQESETILIKDGLIIDPKNNLNKKQDLMIEKGIIKLLQDKVADHLVFDKVINARDKVVCPGFIDMHVHLREPGREDEETIQSGALAAAQGGFTAVACMPNTQPVIDQASLVEFVYKQSQNAAANVYPIAAITKGQAGKELTEMNELISFGAVGFSDDGRPVEDARILRHALEYSKMFDRPVISHCEDICLTNQGVMNEGKISVLLGLKGIPRISEEIIVDRDIRIAEYVRARIHIAHVSTGGAVRIIRAAKDRGVRVTCETAPHYFTLTEELIKDTYNTNAKMYPPLRTRGDIEEIKQGLADGTIDAIATDHAPHALEEKDCEFEQAANGILGLETALALSLEALVNSQELDLPELIEKITLNPAKILNIDYGEIKVGCAANLTVFDPKAEWVYKKENIVSLSCNTPYLGRPLQGRALYTVRRNKIFTARLN